MNNDQRYFKWLCAELGRFDNRYSKLCYELHCFPFVNVHYMDLNREKDAQELRARYFNMEDETNVSVFEMMVALAKRINDITDDGEKDLTWFWFKTMISSMGLENQTNSHIDYVRIENALCSMMNGCFDQNGRGGLFYIPNYNGDMREKEIWYQAMEYLNYWYGLD